VEHAKALRVPLRDADDDDEEEVGSDVDVIIWRRVPSSGQNNMMNNIEKLLVIDIRRRLVMIKG
jgi:hypothetical protein